MYTKNGKEFGTDKELDLNLSLNSTFTKAKCIFSKAALRLYKEKSIKIPDCIYDFLETPMLEKMSTNYIPIPKEIDDEIIRLTTLAFEEKNQIKDKDKPFVPSKDIAVAVELARFCGLTSKEIVGIRWEWFEKRNDSIILSIRNRFKTDTSPAWASKGNKKNGDLEIKKERFEKWESNLNPQKKEYGYVFDLPTDNARENFIRRTASQWVRQFIPDRTKSLHELRKQAGSEVATKHGIYVAAKFLRDTVAVAEMHYASLLNAPKAL